MKELLYNVILPFIFEKSPLKFLNSYKTLIGRILQCLSIVLVAAQNIWPHLTILSVINGYDTLILGYFITEVGVAHAESKEARGL